MKKSFVILAFLIFLMLNGCTPSGTEEMSIGSEEPVNKYTINIDYDKKENILKGHEKIVYHNKQSKKVSSILLYLYPNMYRKLETVPSIGSPEKCYPEGFNEGYIRISDVKIRGKEIKLTTEGEYTGIYIDIPLEKPIEKSSDIEIEMDFEVKIPISTTRFGQYKDITQFTYWYPILAVQSAGNWEIRDYYTIGESNYSDVADYDIEIKLPEEEKIASTGRITSEAESDEKGYKIVKIKAENVRDFAWVSSPNFIIEESMIDGIKILNCYTKKNKELGHKADEIVAEVISYYNSKFGLYSYKEFSIVETYLTGGGMEYPQLITLGQSHYKDVDKLTSVIAHEGAHQWWYAAVGNDEHENPWLDEGLANYSGQLYLAYKARTGEKLNFLMGNYESLHAPNLDIEASVRSFSTWKEYNDVIYKKGALTLHKLRTQVGDDKFFKIMQTYYERYKLKNAEVSDFLSVVEEIAGKEAVEIFFRKTY